MAGQRQSAGRQAVSEEAALLWEVKALMAQKQLVQQQVRSLMSKAAATPGAHAAREHAVLNELESLLGSRHAVNIRASPSSVLARADKAAKMRASSHSAKVADSTGTLALPAGRGRSSVAARRARAPAPAIADLPIFFMNSRLSFSFNISLIFIFAIHLV